MDVYLDIGIADNLERNTMVVTALAPRIGYDTATAVAQKAESEGLTIREAAIELGHVTGEQYDQWVDPRAMTEPS